MAIFYKCSKCNDTIQSQGLTNHLRIKHGLEGEVLEQVKDACIEVDTSTDGGSTEIPTTDINKTPTMPIATGQKEEPSKTATDEEEPIISVPGPEEQMREEMAALLKNELSSAPNMSGESKVAEYIVKRFKEDPSLMADPNHLMYVIMRAGPKIPTDVVQWIVHQVFNVKNKYPLARIQAVRDFTYTNPYGQQPMGGANMGNMNMAQTPWFNQSNQSGINQQVPSQMMPPSGDSELKKMIEEQSKEMKELREEVKRGEEKSKFEQALKETSDKYEKQMQEMKELLKKQDGETKVSKLENTIESLGGHVAGLEKHNTDTIRKIENMFQAHAHKDDLAKKDLEKTDLMREQDKRLDDIKRNLETKEKPKTLLDSLKEIKETKSGLEEMSGEFGFVKKDSKDKSTGDKLAERIGSIMEKGEDYLFKEKNDDNRLAPATKPFQPINPTTTVSQQPITNRLQKEENERLEAERLKREVERLEKEQRDLKAREIAASKIHHPDKNKITAPNNTPKKSKTSKKKKDVKDK